MLRNKRIANSIPLSMARRKIIGADHRKRHTLFTNRSQVSSRSKRRTVAAVSLSAAIAAVLSGCFAPPTEASVGFDGLQSATIQLEALGRFIQPGTTDSLGSGTTGSGFFITSSGLAITNTHVVAGAGTVEVWTGDDPDNSFGATVLGSSECLDLAVVQVEGSNFPFLSWYEGEIETALEVYSAGFPLGLQYTLTRGIVSKADIPFDSNWASLDRVIEHDARTRGGNSGGPLVDADGRVVGVNYAGENEFDFNFAIHRDQVLPVLQDLIDGKPVLSLGVNAEALPPDDDGAPLGVWATSIVAGGPADLAGIEAGDLLVDLAGIPLAQSGTMEEYCEVVRTQGVDATIDVTVYRPSEDRFYEGQFNGRELAASEAGGGSQPTPEPAGSFVTVSDDSGAISVSVPDTWSQVDGSQTTDAAGDPVFKLTASPDIAAFLSGFDVPGLRLEASQTLDSSRIAEVLLSLTVPLSAVCTPSESGPYDDSFYVGEYSYLTDCGSAGSDVVVVVAEDIAGTHLMFLTAQLVSSEDKTTVLEKILATFIASF